MTKAGAIKQFDALYLGGYAVAIVGSLLGMGTARAAMAAAGMAGADSGIAVGSIAFSVVIALLLWFFISARHSDIAKWIAVVLVAVGLLSELRAFLGPAAVVNGVTIATDKTAMIVGLIGVMLEAAGLSRLFTPEGRAWMSARSEGSDAARSGLDPDARRPDPYVPEPPLR